MDLNKKISSIMISSLTSVRQDTPVEELKNLINRRGIHHLPVEDIDGKVIGIISTEDLSRISKFLPSANAITAQHIMTPNPVKVAKNLPIGQAWSIFLDNRFRALPVVDNEDNLVGIITPYDFLEMILLADS